MLEKYLKSFSNLRTDKNRKRCPPLTDHQALHKPFFLLSVMDLMAQGQIIVKGSPLDSPKKQLLVQFIGEVRLTPFLTESQEGGA